MEKTWFPQQSRQDSSTALLKNLVLNLNHPISRITIEKTIKSHPAYPNISLSIISDILASWGIENQLHYLKSDEIKKLTPYSVLLIHETFRGNIFKSKVI